MLSTPSPAQTTPAAVAVISAFIAAEAAAEAFLGKYLDLLGARAELTLVHGSYHTQLPLHRACMTHSSNPLLQL